MGVLDEQGADGYLHGQIWNRDEDEKIKVSLFDDIGTLSINESSKTLRFTRHKSGRELAVKFAISGDAVLGTHYTFGNAATGVSAVTIIGGVGIISIPAGLLTMLVEIIPIRNVDVFQPPKILQLKLLGDRQVQPEYLLDMADVTLLVPPYIRFVQTSGPNVFVDGETYSFELRASQASLTDTLVRVIWPGTRFIPNNYPGFGFTAISTPSTGIAGIGAGVIIPAGETSPEPFVFESYLLYGTTPSGSYGVLAPTGFFGIDVIEVVTSSVAYDLLFFQASGVIIPAY
jgi:hypothetical protein